MDYKELLKRLHDHSQSLAAYNDHSLSYTLEDAIAAIGTLLAERDATVEELRGICHFCAHKKTCQFGNHLRDICVNGSNWQWHGPQKSKEAPNA